MLWEKKWKKGVIEEKKEYSVAKFNKKNLPTIGSVGFTIKKEYLLKTNYDPAFSHLDAMQDLLKQGYNQFAFIRLDVIHLHSSNYSEFIGKLKRNFKIFIRDNDKRRYKWDSTIGEKAYATIVMLTFVLPFYHAMRGYFKIRDKAWLLHPFVCFSVMASYLKIFLSWKLGFNQK
jgi:hypothetical protein